jgi:hypothetical protein
LDQIILTKVQAMAQKWYYAEGEQRRGPFSASQLRQLVVDGRVLPDTLVLKDGAQQWVAAGSIRALFPAAPPAAVPQGAGPDWAALDAPQQQYAPRRPVGSRVRTPPKRRVWPWLAAAAVMFLVMGMGVSLAIVGMGFRIPNLAGKGGQKGTNSPDTVPSASDLTKEEFREKLTSLRKPDGFKGYYLENDLLSAFGKPTRTQTMGELKYWYWQCRDGTVQVVVDWYGAMPKEKSKRVYLKEINDF